MGLQVGVPLLLCFACCCCLGSGDTVTESPCECSSCVDTTTVSTNQVLLSKTCDPGFVVSIETLQISSPDESNFIVTTRTLEDSVWQTQAAGSTTTSSTCFSLLQDDTPLHVNNPSVEVEVSCQNWWYDCPLVYDIEAICVLAVNTYDCETPCRKCKPGCIKGPVSFNGIKWCRVEVDGNSVHVYSGDLHITGSNGMLQYNGFTDSLSGVELEGRGECNATFDSSACCEEDSEEANDDQSIYGNVIDSPHYEEQDDDDDEEEDYNNEGSNDQDSTASAPTTETTWITTAHDPPINPASSSGVNVVAIAVAVPVISIVVIGIGVWFHRKRHHDDEILPRTTVGGAP